MKTIYFFYGTHGSGKSYWAKYFSRTTNGLYWNTDLRAASEWKEWDVESLSLYEKQKKFMEYNFGRLSELYFNLYTDKVKENIIYVDFGPHQILPYLKRLKFTDLYKEWKEKSEKVIEYFQKGLDCCVGFYYIKPTPKILRNNIVNRGRKEWKWELKTALEIQELLEEEINHLPLNIIEVERFEDYTNEQ